MWTTTSTRENTAFSEKNTGELSKQPDNLQVACHMKQLSNTLHNTTEYETEKTSEEA